MDQIKQYDSLKDADFIQDLFTLYISLQIQKRIKDVYLQELYGFLEVYMSAIIIYEYIDSEPELAAALGRDYVKKIELWRDRFLKQNVIKGSKKMRKISSSMGTDFGHYSFDTIITKNTVNDELIGINFGTWDLTTISEEDKELFNSLLKTVEVVFNNSFDREMLSGLDASFSQFACNVDNRIKLKRYTYASGVMFKGNNLQITDKHMIIFYYSFFKYLYYSEELIPEAVLNLEGFTAFTMRTLTKMRASLIAHFENNIKSLDTPFQQKIYEALPDRVLNKELYGLNRKLRNNIHYTRTDRIEETQWDEIKSFQKDYFKATINTFDDSLKVKTGKWYETILWIALHTDADFRRYYYGK